MEMLTLYWDAKLQAETIAKQQAIWYTALKEFSYKTVAKVTMEWIKTHKHKPTPADLREMCDNIDEIPAKLRRLHHILNLPIEEIIPEPEKEMLGCPIKLSRMIGKAKTLNQQFTEDEQMDYLATGTPPTWYETTPSDQTNTNPSTAF